MKKIMLILSFFCVLNVFSQNLIGKTKEQVLQHWKQKVSDENITEYPADEDSQAGISVSFGIDDLMYFFNKANICVEFVTKTKSDNLSILIANLNANKKLKLNKNGEWIDAVKKFKWTIKDLDNQRIELKCIKY